MKKALLPLLIASVLPAAAIADVTVYGKANVSFQSTDKSGSQYTEVVSNSSRIGLKGSDAINDDLKVIYQFEYQTKVDDGSNSQTCTAASTSTTTAPAATTKTTTTCTVSGQTFSQRNIYVGLKGSGGTVMAGMFDTPVKLAQEKVDLFNDLIGDMQEVFQGENRVKNVIQYSTPTFSNITLNAAYINSEHDVPDGTDGYSLSATYATKPMYFAVAYEQNAKLASDRTASQYDVDLWRAVGRFTIGPVVLGAMYEAYDNGNVGTAAIDEDGFLLSAQYNITDKWAAKIQTAQSDMKMLGGETTSVGVDYKLSKATKLYGFFTMIENDAAAKRDDEHLGVGIELNF